MKHVQRFRALVRWFKRNRKLRLAVYIARNGWARRFATLVQPLWLTPQRYRDMRPIRKWGYVVACLVYAASIWSEATFRIYPEAKSATLTKFKEASTSLGLVDARAPLDSLVGASPYLVATTVTAVLILFLALSDYISVRSSDFVAMILRRRRPFSPHYRYFVLHRSGTIAGLFTVFGGLMILFSPWSLSLMEERPMAASAAFAFLIIGGGGLSVRYFLAEHERDREIYGEGSWAVVLRLAGVVGIFLFLAMFYALVLLTAALW